MVSAKFPLSPILKYLSLKCLICRSFYFSSSSTALTAFPSVCSSSTGLRDPHIGPAHSIMLFYSWIISFSWSICPLNVFETSSFLPLNSISLIPFWPLSLKQSLSHSLTPHLTLFLLYLWSSNNFLTCLLIWSLLFTKNFPGLQIVLST